nr:YitT family protein [bacterium]
MARRKASKTAVRPIRSGHTRGRHIAWEYAMLMAGAAVASAGYGIFLVPRGIAPGGLTGIATILHMLVGGQVGLWVMALNVPIFAAGLKSLGRRFLIKSLIGMVVFSAVVDWVPPFHTQDPWLAALYGGLMVGAGLGLVVRAGGSTGGTDMLARLVQHKARHVKMGEVLFGVDLVVVAASGIALQSAAVALYSLAALYISTWCIDRVLDGFTRTKSFFIITRCPQQVADGIMTRLERGCTRIPAQGVYSGEERDILLCVVPRQQAVALKHIVADADAGAFMLLWDTAEVYGLGFLPNSGG